MSWLVLAALMLVAIGPTAHAEHCPIASAIANVSADISVDKIARLDRERDNALTCRAAPAPDSSPCRDSLPHQPDKSDQMRGDKIGIVKIGSRYIGASQI